MSALLAILSLLACPSAAVWGEPENRTVSLLDGIPVDKLNETVPVSNASTLLREEDVAAIQSMTEEQIVNLVRASGFQRIGDVCAPAFSTTKDLFVMMSYGPRYMVHHCMQFCIRKGCWYFSVNYVGTYPTCATTYSETGVNSYTKEQGMGVPVTNVVPTIVTPVPATGIGATEDEVKDLTLGCYSNLKY